MTLPGVAVHRPEAAAAEYRGDDQTPADYPAGQTSAAVIELRTAGSQTASAAQSLKAAGGLVGLGVEYEGAKFTAWFNSADRPAALPLEDVKPAHRLSLLRPQPNSPGERDPSPPTAPRSEPAQVILIIDSPEDSDHQKGHASFQDMTGRNMPRSR